MAASVSTSANSPVGNYKSGLLALVVLVGTLFLGLNPHSHGPACLFRAATGIPCPGCGITRSLSSVWRGDFLMSFRFHPLGLPVFLICVAALLMLCLERFVPRSRPAIVSVRRAFMHFSTLTTVAVVMVVLWLVRLGLFHAGNTFFLW